MFKTLHTLYGLSALAQAEASGEPINLPEMAVGDGNGRPTNPQESDTQLVRERFRANVNRVYQSPDEPNRFTAELVIPAAVGGFTIREVAVFDSFGSMFVVGNLPDTYKPTKDEGAFSDVVVRVDFVVSNAKIILLLVDPNVAVASQQWVLTNLSAARIIPGGTVTQFLGKASNADGDYEWKDLGDVEVHVDTIAEKQLLAEGQTTVDLSVTTTYGLAVYVEGLRLDMGSGADEWQPDEELHTRLTLGKSYPANTRITLVNNEPAGSAPAPLERSKNLSDVPDKAKGRNNLDVFSKAETRIMAPAGLVATFARSTAPAGWLKANGAAVSRTAYPDLWVAIGTTFGPGNGGDTFSLPDLRGEFIRGWDDGRGVDVDRKYATSQAGDVVGHTHTATSADAGDHQHTGTAVAVGDHTHSGWAEGSGEHAHAAWTDIQGDHVHNVKEGNIGPGGADERLTSGDDWTQTVGSWSTTNVGGAHGHNITVAVDGLHAHTVTVGAAGTHAHDLAIGAGGVHKHIISVGNTGGRETRPRNVALLVCIKY
ncbi:phage tail-collar fiber domain-containing protein [Pseudomonas knackmussii]|uniref:phage tail-collar fiber domain-containing protein n=1 Tax=Pseudomonas knackmussii TaxID=65741 RepID=UPI003F4A75AE